MRQQTKARFLVALILAKGMAVCEEIKNFPERYAFRKKKSSRDWIRTSNRPINSRMLCR